MTVLVDSDILIEVARGRNASVVSQWMALSDSDALVLYSAVSVAELWAGVRPGEADTLESLFEALVCVPVDSSIGRHAGDFLRLYRKSHAVELGDALIAACALARHAVLWTRNRKHYPMKDLTFFD
ncbi:type II toxin-antitoxin system VapC family toxin [Paludibaculum fermentans]|uniref:Type II toxin-antitoxin system VapC family toxin n=1 Tax=Paludibaculum fermentans TaxID=1473598 RepID=A0A7S7NWV8_PALFE|nr:type II toxin-antitoxin system VapC family toxin [Paludibaculum fermentans]QOY91280.1 type II toxin-antitoxin system VapC family toxin [Paludibaculum fermentans]